MAGYAKRYPGGVPSWPAGPALQKADYDAWEQALYDLKYLNFNVEDFRQPGEDFTNLTDNTATFLATVAAANAAGGGRVLLPQQLRLDGLVSMAGYNNVKVLGHGIQASTVRCNTTAGHQFDWTNASFCEFRGATIVFQVQKTAGSLFHLDQTTGTQQQCEIDHLWVLSAYRAFEMLAGGTTDIHHIQFGDYNATWPWNSGVFIDGSISDRIEHIRGGTSAGMTNGLLVIQNGDSLHFDDWECVGYSNSVMTGINLNGSTWAKFNRMSIESGNGGYALTVNGSQSACFTNSHFLGRCAINGGQTDLKLIGGEWIESDIHGLQLAGGIDTLISGIAVRDSGAAYNCIDVSNGVNDFTIVDCVLGRNYITARQPDRLIRIGSSANGQDRYVVRGNRGRNFTGGAGLLDNGTGVNKDVGGNVFVA